MQPNGAEVLKNNIDKIIFYHDKLRFQNCLSIFTNIDGLVRYNGRLGSTKFLNEQICFKIGQNRDCNFQILTVGSKVIGIADAARLLAWLAAAGARRPPSPPPTARCYGTARCYCTARCCRHNSRARLHETRLNEISPPPFPAFGWTPGVSAAPPQCISRGAGKCAGIQLPAGRTTWTTTPSKLPGTGQPHRRTCTTNSRGPGRSRPSSRRAGKSDGIWGATRRGLPMKMPPTTKTTSTMSWQRCRRTMSLCARSTAEETSRSISLLKAS